MAIPFFDTIDFMFRVCASKMLRVPSITSEVDREADSLLEVVVRGRGDALDGRTKPKPTLTRLSGPEPVCGRPNPWIEVDRAGSLLV